MWHYAVALLLLSTGRHGRVIIIWAFYNKILNSTIFLIIHYAIYREDRSLT